MSKYDAIVVGAGPAGSTAARHLAEAGHTVLLVDKAKFPRHKTCAGWVSRKAFDQFEYLTAHQAEFVESSFYGVIMHKGDMSKQVEYREDQPAGYLAVREKLDAVLVRLAVEAGAELVEGVAVAEVKDSGSSVGVRLADGSTHTAQAVVGADGVQGVVGKQSGINPQWDAGQLIICSHEDVPCAASEVDALYGAGSDRLIHIWPGYEMMAGYAWLFPKKEHIGIGLGGKGAGHIGAVHEAFVGRLRERGLVPAGLPAPNPGVAMDPAGCAHRLAGHTRGRVVLVGDAGGFVAGLSGEGIYAAMCSARCAARLIHRGIESHELPAALQEFDSAWKAELGPFLQSPSGVALVGMLQFMFSSQKLAAKLARSFLHGEPLSLF